MWPNEIRPSTAADACAHTRVRARHSGQRSLRRTRMFVQCARKPRANVWFLSLQHFVSHSKTRTTRMNSAHKRRTCSVALCLPLGDDLFDEVEIPAPGRRCTRKAVNVERVVSVDGERCAVGVVVLYVSVDCISLSLNVRGRGQASVQACDILVFAVVVRNLDVVLPLGDSLDSDTNGGGRARIDSSARHHLGAWTFRACDAPAGACVRVGGARKNYDENVFVAMDGKQATT